LDALKLLYYLETMLKSVCWHIECFV